MRKRRLKVTTIGQGYVGLPLSLLLSKNKQIVCAYDNNLKLIKKFNNGTYGRLNENEKEVIDLYHRQLKRKNLKFSSKILPSDIYILCVPTPIKKNKKPNLNFVFSAIKEIIQFLKNGDLIIIESTIAIGTTKKIKKIIDSKCKEINYSIAYCPERVLPGNAIKEIVNNDRIIGAENKKTHKFVTNFYKMFVKGNIYLTSIEVAEFTKLAENSYRDTNIAFANELAVLCEKNEVNPKDVIFFANKHPRVNILSPGIGVGGHCIPIDPWFLIENYKNKNSIIRNSRIVNKAKTKIVSNKIVKTYKTSFVGNNESIFILGLSYKANVGDFRESPSLEIISNIKSRIKGKIYVNDPYIKNLKEKNIKVCSVANGFRKSKIIVILVPHKEYKNLNLHIKKTHIVLDECNILNKGR